MSFWNVLLVIIVILAILLVVLYILGSRMQKRQAEQQTMIDASKQTVSILAIDKKKLKIGDSGLPKMVIDQTPWYMKWAKLPIVKAKIGPKVVTMIADEKVFLQLPLRTEAKVVISGLYITEIKSVRGGIPPLPKKKKFFDRFKKNTEEAAICAAANESEKNLMLELSKFNAMMENAFEETAPHKVCSYIYDLAYAFNTVYHGNKIMAEEDEARQKSYIRLLELTKAVLETSIDVLGFSAPDRM